jgi:integrase
MRNMRKDVFQSVFADEIRDYIDKKVNLGFKESSYYYQLKEFDSFCSTRDLDRTAFSREDADAWIIRNAGEGDRGYCNRICVVKNFLIYLSQQGCDVFATQNIKYSVSDFKPHIYSDDEALRYFSAIDSYETSRARMNAIHFPILFRILYCCGTRLHETLCICVNDVDFREGTIRLKETKNHNERLVALGGDLKELMISFADKSFYLLKDTDYIFTSSRGSYYSNDRIYTVHRFALEKAEIPYIGDREGPRIHDWRHTFAVRSFKQMIDAGMDMYTSLPILSTYLGHKSIYATERYLRLTMSVYPYIEEKCRKQMEDIFGLEANHEKN